jgi:hypothetical protein
MSMAAGIEFRPSYRQATEDFIALARAVSEKTVTFYIARALYP